MAKDEARNAPGTVDKEAIAMLAIAEEGLSHARRFAAAGDLDQALDVAKQVRDALRIWIGAR